MTAEQDYINLLVLNAGVPGPRSKSLLNATMDEFITEQWSISEEEFDEPFRVRLMGSWFTAIGFPQIA